MDALQFLFSLERLGMKFGLENMRTICAALDHPERAFRSVIVAGTNGKGSVAAMVSAALHAGGHRSARYTSPHLERLEERFVLDEQEVSSDALESAAEKVRVVVEQLVRDGRLETLPTFFECATAIGFVLFRHAAVEVAVVEVGLGGRLDATNVITPMVAAITSIDLDHQELLGTTLPEIAREKAGVIKPGRPVVAGRLAAEARAVIEATCRERDSPFISAPERVATAFEVVEGQTIATLTSPVTTLAKVPLALRGRHQLDNAAVALCVMESLAASGVALPATAMRAGLSDTRWPGRIERFRWRGAEVILDAAHNPAGARALAAYLKDQGWGEVTMVLGVMADKDVDGMLMALMPLARTVVCTTPPSPRAMPAAQLATRVTAAAGPGTRLLTIADPAQALTAACEDGARVVAAGSIFLIGPLRGILR